MFFMFLIFQTIKGGFVVTKSEVAALADAYRLYALTYDPKLASAVRGECCPIASADFRLKYLCLVYMKRIGILSCSSAYVLNVFGLFYNFFFGRTEICETI